MNLAEAFQAAVTQHQAGQLKEADSLYRQILAAAPDHAHATHMLGVLALQCGQVPLAIELITRAIRLEENQPLFHANLGAAYLAAGDLAQAETSTRRALALEARDARLWLALGKVLQLRTDMTGARTAYQRALQLEPRLSDAALALGDLEASDTRWPQAEQAYRVAANNESPSATLLTRLAVSLQAQGKLAGAIAKYRKALNLEPRYTSANYNLGTALNEQGERDEAARHFEQALISNPNHAGSHSNLGAYHQDQGNLDEAFDHYGRVLQVEPNAPEAHFNRALILLMQGNFQQGWPEYEWRQQLPGFPVRRVPGAIWDGAPTEKQVLIHSEQGLGDTLHFVRYVQEAHRRCPRLRLQVPEVLLTLLRQSGLGELLIGNAEPAECDMQAPLLSLPLLLNANVADAGALVPYLSADRDAVIAWGKRLEALPGKRIGITWQGSPTHASDRRRSISLKHFAPLAALPGVTLISLQKAAGSEQRLAAGFEVHEPAESWDEAAGPFVDTAAIMKNLDLVVTADTATAHLAGGLGVPVWVALATKADWRWFLSGDRTPWYPTMRLYRQTHAGDWDAVFQRIANDIKELFSESRPSHH